jgi:hypothetical protein
MSLGNARVHESSASHRRHRLQRESDGHSRAFCQAARKGHSHRPRVDPSQDVGPAFGPANGGNLAEIAERLSFFAVGPVHFMQMPRFLGRLAYLRCGRWSISRALAHEQMNGTGRHERCREECRFEGGRVGSLACAIAIPSLVPVSPDKARGRSPATTASAKEVA